MPTNQPGTEYEQDQRNPNEQKTQQDAQALPAQEESQSDDIEGFNDNTEELGADSVDNDPSDLAAGDEGIDDANVRQASDDADIESGKRIDRDESEQHDIEREEDQT